MNQIVLAICVINLLMNIIFIFLFKKVLYLLKVPVVKKISKDQNFKPVRVDNDGQSRGRYGASNNPAKETSNDRNGRNDRNRNKGRNKGPRSDSSSRGPIQGNKAAEAPTTPVKPAEVKAQQVNPAILKEPTKETSIDSSPNPVSLPEIKEKPEKIEAVQVAANSNSGEEIHHGRRIKVKKAPNFEE